MQVGYMEEFSSNNFKIAFFQDFFLSGIIHISLLTILAAVEQKH
jgi:hypothetical protein